LVPMHDGRVLDWFPDGTWRLFNYDPSNKLDCLPDVVAMGEWISIDNNHTLAPMHDGRVLDWTGQGAWRLWDYDSQGRSMVSGNVLLRNESQNEYTHLRLRAPDQTLLRGTSAEWIVERPGESNNWGNEWLTHLADYGTVKFTHAHAERIGGATMKPGDGEILSMTEDGKTVSTCTATGKTVTCTFV
jgi:Peptidase A4 family